MSNKLREESTTTSSRSAGAATLHAAIGRFANAAHAQEAIRALKRAGFANDVISVRHVRLPDQNAEVTQAETTPMTIVGVQAKGERAAEAWSILHNVGP